MSTHNDKGSLLTYYFNLFLHWLVPFLLFIFVFRERRAQVGQNTNQQQAAVRQQLCRHAKHKKERTQQNMIALNLLVSNIHGYWTLETRYSYPELTHLQSCNKFIFEKRRKKPATSNSINSIAQCNTHTNTHNCNIDCLINCRTHFRHI